MPPPGVTAPIPYSGWNGCRTFRTASASSDVADPNGANNSASDIDTVTRSADLSIAKTDSADPVIPGQAFTYTLTVTNAGPSNATALTVSDTVPPQFTVTGTATGSAIAVIDVTGEGAKPIVLTDWSMYATYPDWRPGWDQILFSTYDLGEFQATDEPSNLYTIRPDGSGQTALTSFGKGEQRATQPTWTSDGSRIIFTLVGQQAAFDSPREAAFIVAVDRVASAITKRGIFP